MYFVLKTTKGHDYIQLVDNNQYTHHIGPATLENLALAAYAVGLDEAFKLYGRMLEYFVKKNTPNPSKLASDIAGFYKSGFLGLSMGSIGEVSEEEFSSRVLSLMDKIYILAMLDQRLREQFKDNPYINVRKLAQKLYKDATEEKKAQWLKELQEQREKRFQLLK